MPVLLHTTVPCQSCYIPLFHASPAARHCSMPVLQCTTVPCQSCYTALFHSSTAAAHHCSIPVLLHPSVPFQSCNPPLDSSFHSDTHWSMRDTPCSASFADMTFTVLLSASHITQVSAIYNKAGAILSSNIHHSGLILYYARATLDKQSCVITPTFVYHD